MPEPDALRRDSGMRPAGASESVWTARVLHTGENAATVHARNHVFSVGLPAGFAPTDERPSAVEYLLGALGGDLVNGFARIAARRGTPIDALEAAVSGRLNNPLVVLGVIGESGHPGFEAISVTLYVSAEADESALNEIWQATLAASPLVHTLRHAAALSLEMQTVL